jgi:hypothetical protein
MVQWHGRVFAPMYFAGRHIPYTATANYLCLYARYIFELSIVEAAGTSLTVGKWMEVPKVDMMSTTARCLVTIPSPIMAAGTQNGWHRS